ncbi:pentatricopeptide repeat-containing protein At4g37170 [Aristolochia californica]|uniref:pentatricopeptide repeat-containing protein At4g37170 n=1 Tax=Aristolochia californica TaxID=171875 RepID=UPI0035E0B145
MRKKPFFPVNLLRQTPKMYYVGHRLLASSSSSIHTPEKTKTSISSNASIIAMHRSKPISSPSLHSRAENQTTVPSFKFKTEDRNSITELCRDNKFKEAVDILCRQKRLKEAVRILDDIDRSGTRPSAAIYSTLLKLCLQQEALHEGKIVHSHIRSSGFKPGAVISNRLIDMYARCGNLTDARQLFEEMDERDLCSWNTIIAGYARKGELENARQLFNIMTERDHYSWSTMISGYVRHDRPKEALELYRELQRDEGSKDNKFTVSAGLAASAAATSLRYGKEIHSHILRTGFASDAVVWSALSDMYAKCGSIEEARFVFNSILEKDVVTWTTMIGRYLEGGRREEGFELFFDMLRSGVRPNEFTFAGILNACSAQAAEELGKQVHGHMTRVGFDPFSFAASALVDMYSKCGNIESARRVFEAMPQPDIVSWTSMIAGYAQNGQSKEALHYFDLMLNSGTKPDHITFVGVLSACTHAGLTDEGLEIFHSISEKHGLTHTADHYACIVDLLARTGKLEEAEEIIDRMPIKPDKFLWSSLLGGCRIHRNLKLAKRAAEALFQIEPENAATYVTMANIYATAGMWEEVARIRKKMDDRGVVKKPGSSWIEIKRQVHVFLVGDKSHPKAKNIYALLDKLTKRLKEEGHVPDTNFVLHDVEEEQKEQNLIYHSEKLAVAFGILEAPAGTPIKVFKNLRICGDCHSAIKLISRIAEREIMVRDSSRFHRFLKGNCSCGDFW